MLNQTCAAFATAQGQAGLAILRLSGPEAAIIADRVFLAGAVVTANNLRSVFASADTCQKMKGYTCRFGHVYDQEQGHLIDQAIVIKFNRPYSYTGEDVVELSIHGGAAVKEQLLRAVLAQGAVPAGPGEFTKRAFLNGKLDLSQAEAVIDVINAEAGNQAGLALAQLEGQLGKFIQNLREPLITAMAKLELAIQYPEHEESIVDLIELSDNLNSGLKAVQKLIASYNAGKMISEGMTVLLAGSPNAGKSTLLNLLLGNERAIVTDVAGTTRDTLIERMHLAGYALNLIDTAGLRDTDDVVEKIGVERSRKAMLDADLILWLFPSDQDDWPKDLIELQAVRDVKILPLLSKADLVTESAAKTKLLALKNNLQGLDGSQVEILEPQLIAANSEPALDALTAAILAIYQGLDHQKNNGVCITKERHLFIVKQVETILSDLATNLYELPLDVVSIMLQNAAETLAEITGETVTDTVWQEIFSKFCVGK